MRWYYSVELRPGVYTSGHDHLNAAMVRSAIENLDVAGHRCLDIGTQEAMMPVTLVRHGASEVVAYDRLDLSDRIALVKEAYRAEFDYVPACHFQELPRVLRERDQVPFDIVLFSGVLYHMVDPLGGLAIARSFLRENGIFIIETAAVVSEEMSLFFNGKARFHPTSTYFLPSLAWLDYALRMLRLRPIDVIHNSRSRLGEQSRAVIVCQAVPKPLAERDDQWMNGHWIEPDFRPFGLDFASLSSNKPPVSYATADENLEMRRDTGSVDVLKSVLERKAGTLDPAKARLNLLDCCG